MYAAPVTSNVFVEIPITATRRREVYILCGLWSCSAQSCSYSRHKLFVPSGRARAITQGGEERIKICYVQSCLAQSCSDSFT